MNFKPFLTRLLTTANHNVDFLPLLVFPLKQLATGLRVEDVEEEEEEEEEEVVEQSPNKQTNKQGRETQRRTEGETNEDAEGPGVGLASLSGL